MNPLYIDVQRVGIGVAGRSLYVRDLKSGRTVERFLPRNIPYDSMFVQKANGYVSFAALHWLKAHGVSLTVLDWRGNVLSQFVPEEPLNPRLKIAQVRAYEDGERRRSIARTLVETKLRRQSELLSSLSRSYPQIEVPPIEPIGASESEDSLRLDEARYAFRYFSELARPIETLGYSFKRGKPSAHNMHAADLPNALLNYSYAVLQTYVRRAINAVGLQNDIPFLHDTQKSAGLTFDLMELWRTNCDCSVLQALEQLKRSKKTHYLTDGYEVVLEPETVRVAVEKVKSNLSLGEILFNARVFAKSLLGERRLAFALKPVRVNDVFESDSVKLAVLTKTATQLGMNRSTHWYQRKMLRERGALKLYQKTRRYYS